MKTKIKTWAVSVLLPMLLLFLLFVSRAHGQGSAFPPDNGPYQTGQFALLPQNAVPQIVSATAAPTTQIGSTSYFYWIVTHDVTNSRFSIPAGPFFTNIGPAALSLTASIQVNWTPYTLPVTYGQNSPNATPLTSSSFTYDVLRTATGTPPSGSCACAVATGLTGSVIADTGSLGAYTVNVAAWPGNYPKSGNVAGFGPKGSIVDGGVAIPGASIAGIFTVATLPAAPAVNTLAVVTDGIGGIGAGGTSTDCTAGGGTTGALCRWNGVAWVMVGELVPRGPNNSVQFNANGKQNGTANLTWNDSTLTLTEKVNSTSGVTQLYQCDATCGGLVGIVTLVAQGLDSGSTSVQLSNIQTDYPTNTAGGVKTNLNFFVHSNTSLPQMTWKADPTTSGANLTFFDTATGTTSAAIGVDPTGAGTPNPMWLPKATGAAGATLQTDGGSPHQQLSWKSTALQNTVQAYSVTTETVDTALTGSVAAVVITHAVTMPTSGCPCRVLANWAQYMTTTGSAVVAEAWVRDGANNFGEAEWPIPVNNGPSGTGSGLSPVTYANSAVVTFTLTVEVDGSSVTARAAPFHAFGLRNSRLELTVMTSN